MRSQQPGKWLVVVVKDMVSSVLSVNNIVRRKNFRGPRTIVFDTSGLASDAIEYVR